MKDVLEDAILKLAPGEPFTPEEQLDWGEEYGSRDVQDLAEAYRREHYKTRLLRSLLQVRLLGDPPVLSRRDVCARSLTPDWTYEFDGVSRYYLEIVEFRDIEDFDTEVPNSFFFPPQTAGKMRRRMTREEVRDFRTPMIAPFHFWPVEYEGGNLTNPPDDAPEPEFGEMVSYRTPLKKVKPYGMDRGGVHYTFRLDGMFSIHGPELGVGETVYTAEPYVLAPGRVLAGAMVENLTLPKDVKVVCPEQNVYDIPGLTLRPFVLSDDDTRTARLIITNNTAEPQTIFVNEGIGRLHFEFILEQL